MDPPSDVTSQLDRTDEIILTELNTIRQLLECVVGPTSQTLLLWTHNQRRRMRAGECMLQGKVDGKRRRGRPNTLYSSNITKWMFENMERITTETRDRAGWRRLVLCAARAADHHS